MKYDLNNPHPCWKRFPHEPGNYCTVERRFLKPQKPMHETNWPFTILLIGVAFYGIRYMVDKIRKL